MAGAPQEAGTVPVRVQVVDLEPQVVDLVVPTYLPAADLAQRIVRDAGLGAYTADGQRRRFHLRARGRLLDDTDRLDAIGVVPHELLHLIPEAPQGEGVRERPSADTGATAESDTLLQRAGRVVAVLAFAGAWAVAAAHGPTLHVAFWPAIGAGWLAASAAHRRGVSPDLVFAGIWAALAVVSIGVVWLAGLPEVPTRSHGAAFLMISTLGVFVGGGLGWLAWMGPVEPLPADQDGTRRERG